MPDFPIGQRGAVVTVGTFDGVHLGHRAVIDELVARARRTERPSVLVTFEPHPAQVLRPEHALGRLTVAGERIEALAETEVDYVLVVWFDRTVAALEPEAFVERVLVERCGVRDLVVGHDHAFGRGRRGDSDLLRALGSRWGFAVDTVPPVADAGGVTISSSRIRAAVAEADFVTARQLLGRPYRIHGKVEPGARRGREIGVPTLNVRPLPGKLLPPDGVYAVRVEWADGLADGMMNQGPRPTFGDDRRWLEAHLFDFAGDLYGRDVRIEWVERLRDVKRFASVAELKMQLEQDRQSARQALAGSGRNL